jgi:hypothetical protein
MLYYLPVTCNSELKMVYAGAKELMRNQAEVGRIIEIDSAEELEEIEDQLRGEEWRSQSCIPNTGGAVSSVKRDSAERWTCKNDDHIPWWSNTVGRSAKL